MDYLIHCLLKQNVSSELKKRLLSDKSSWKSGKNTAGSHAALVKNNIQLERQSDTSEKASKIIVNSMLSDELIKSFALPRKIHGVMFSRTGIGQGYGSHVDNAYMSSGRSDLSFTIFLNNSEEYEGGELCIQTIQETKKLKLDAGEIVIYPSTSLHSVEKVISGERLVCVGWIQSYVSSNEDRNILFGLDAGAKGLLAKYGRSNELDLIFQSYGNLLRRLGR